MKKSKQTKRALIPSLLAVILCVAMLVGTTFAWFTDTASTSVNKIEAGTLDVELYYANNTTGTEENTTWTKITSVTSALEFVKAAGHTAEPVLWEPGCTYSLPALKIVNAGNLALKYKVVFTAVNTTDENLKLAEVLDVTMNGNPAGTLYEVLTSTDEDGYAHGNLAGNANTDPITLSVKMRETAGNEYQGLSIGGIAVTVYATQDTVEYDSTTNQYDDVDLWDGTVATAEELTAATDAAAHTVTVDSARLLAAVAQAVNNGNDYSGYTIKLTKHLNLANLPWTPIGEKKGTAFKGTFDGGYKTIGGLNVTAATAGKDDDGSELDGYGALFGAIEGGTVKNLTVEGKVSCDNAAGIVARMNGGTIENCTSNVTVTGVRKAGGIVCMTYTTGTTTCTITNCTNNGKVNAVIDSGRFPKDKAASVGGIVGFVGTNVVNVDNCTNNGAIGSANSEYCGGIIGWVTSNTAAVTNSTNNGSVTGKTNTAGIIGIVNNGSRATITSCTNNGTITANGGLRGNICTLNGNARVNLDGTEKTGPGAVN